MPVRALVATWVTLVAPPVLARPAAANPGACITQFTVAQDVSIDGDHVTFCDGRRKRPACFATDLATGKATPAAKPTTRSGDPKAPTIVIKGKTARVCKADGTSCKSLAPRAYVDEGLGMHGTANPSGSLVALVNTDQVETFHLKTGKRIAGFKAGKGSCSFVTFLGEDTLLVQNEACGGGDGTSWLANPRGKRIAAIGGTKPIEAMPPVALDASRAAFASTTGDVVVVQDVRTGKVVKRIAIAAAAEDNQPTLVGDGTRLVAVFGGARWGDVAVVDLATDQVTMHVARRCAP